MWRDNARRRRGADPAIGGRDSAVPPCRCDGSGSGAVVDPRRRVRHRKGGTGRCAVPPLRPRTRRDGRVGGLPARAGASLPRSLEDCYSALQWLVRLPSVDPVAGGHRGCQRGRGARRGAGPAHPGPRRNQPCGTAIGVSDARRPHRGPQGSGQSRAAAVEPVQQQISAGPPTSAVRTRRWPCPRGAKISAGCRLPGWAWARSTCFTTRTWPTPSGSRPPVCGARSRSSLAHSTASTASSRKPHVSQSFFDSQCALLREVFAPTAA